MRSTPDSMLVCLLFYVLLLHRALFACLQIQMQDALEAAVEAKDKDTLEQHLQSDQAQVLAYQTSPANWRNLFGQTHSLV